MLCCFCFLQKTYFDGLSLKKVKTLINLKTNELYMYALVEYESAKHREIHLFRLSVQYYLTLFCNELK